MGIYLSKPNKTKHSVDGEGPGFKYGLSSMQGWRMTMEDSHISEPMPAENAYLFAVFDGHGGPEVAKFCTKYFPQHLKINQNYLDGKYEVALQENFLKMDELLLSDQGAELLKEFRGDNEMSGSMAGCTANVVLFVNGTAYIANAGDSRAIVYTTTGEVVPLSFDHKPDSDIEKTRIQNAGGYVSNGRVNDNLNLSRAIGDLEYKKNATLPPQAQIISAFPDVMVRKIQPEDKYMLIGCDGIWETHTVQEMYAIIEGKIKETDVKVSAVVEELMDKLIAKETIEGVGCDNMSAILIRFEH